MNDDLREYVPHEGTIKIAGGTVPRRAGKCAIHFLSRGVSPIEFFCIGAGANQQATKSMGIFLHMVERANTGMTVAFKPYRYKTPAKDAGSDILRDKDCTVWTTIILSSSTPIHGS